MTQRQAERRAGREGPGRAGREPSLIKTDARRLGAILASGNLCFHAGLLCLNLQPNTTTQAPERSDILNVGGFSDAVFRVVAALLADDAGRFVAEVEKVEL